MNNLSLMGAVIGVHDGLNPCMFMACAVFIAMGDWLKSRFLKMGRLRLVFIFIYAFCFMAVTFSPLQVLVLQKKFIFSARIIYFVLGLWAFVSGILYLRAWSMIRRGLIKEGPVVHKPKPFNTVVALCITFFLAVVLSVLSSLWPIDKYTLVLGNEAMLKGQWKNVMPMLTCYVLVAMWPLWMVWIFISIREFKPSLVKIFCSAIYFTASTCVIFLIK